jgi:hypothetical protein
MSMRSMISRHPVWTAAALAAVAVIAFVLYWFQPQALLMNETVEETLPAGAAVEGGGSGGNFVGLAHSTSGRALIVELEDGSRLLRLEDLETDNGPDLRVYLTTEPAEGDSSAFDDDFLDLGSLKGNMGDQNYEIPSDADISMYESAVIWCRRFSVAFGAAPLG